MTTALITGVSRGIGEACANSFLNAGWQVWGISRSQPQIKDPNFKWLEFDLTEFDKYQDLDGRLPKHLDLVINNAGIAYGIPFSQTNLLDIDKQWGINVKAPIWLLRNLLPRLSLQTKIINLSSLASKLTFAHEESHISLYSATKAALDKFTKEFSAETKIPACSVLPSMVNTPLVHSLYPDSEFDKLLQPDQVADFINKLVREGFEAGAEYILVNDYLREDLDLLTTQQKNPHIVNLDQPQELNPL